MGNEQPGGMGPAQGGRAEKYCNTNASPSEKKRAVPAASPRVKSAAAAAAKNRLATKNTSAISSSYGKVSSSDVATTASSSTSSSKNTQGTTFTTKEADIAKGRKYHKVNIGQRNYFEVDVRYQNLKNIASGAYGTVCSADDVIIGDSVAIKKVADVFEDLVDAKRILREVKLLRHLSGHHNIIQLRDVMTSPSGSTDFNDLYLVFDRYECDLDRLISMGQELSDAHNKYFLYQMLKGLKFVHSAGVMHRDLKPANILINSNCDLVICDFGLARGKVDTNQTEYVVTRWYRAPELLCDNSHYDGKIDVWSTALVYAELLLGKTLLPGRDYMDQLRRTVKLVGQPTEEDMAFLVHPAAKKAIRRMDFPGVPFNRLFADQDANCIDLLKKMLTFNPEKRISVEEALQHDYLADVREELKADEPVCEIPFDASFEADYPLEKEMPKSLLQKYMYAEMVYFSNHQSGI
jgi:mitogen-activated protein kinase 1/3